MSSQYKDNIFSTEKLSTSDARSQNNVDKTVRPNIDHLIKRLHVQRRQENIKSMALGFLVLAIIFILILLNIN